MKATIADSGYLGAIYAMLGASPRLTRYISIADWRVGYQVMLAPTMQVQLYFFIPMQLRVLMAGVTIVSVSRGEVCFVLNVASVGAVRPSLSPQLWYELRGTLGRLGIWSCGGVDAAEVYGVHAEMVNHVGSTLLSG